MTPSRQSDLPDDPAESRIFAGRTGLGADIDVRDEGEWLTFRYVDADGDVAGFALNPLYADSLALAMLGRVRGRDSGHRRGASARLRSRADRGDIPMSRDQSYSLRVGLSHAWRQLGDQADGLGPEYGGPVP
jgi:hypothetical protein